MQKQQAQQRADRIRSFTQELETLEHEDILVLDESQKLRLAEYHQTMLARFSSLYDVDISRSDKQLSWSMRIVSFLGALALSAAVFFFFIGFGMAWHRCAGGDSGCGSDGCGLRRGFRRQARENALFRIPFQPYGFYVFCA